MPEHQHVCGHIKKEEEETNNSVMHSDLILRNRSVSSTLVSNQRAMHAEETNTLMIDYATSCLCNDTEPEKDASRRAL